MRSAFTVLAAALSVMLLALTDVNAAAGKRRALVIANAQYLNTSELKNPANDAALIESKLRSVGFEVQLEKNLSAKRFSEALQKFSSGLDKESEAVFYYAGHGLQFQGENFLVGIDATLKSEADLQFETFRLNTIINVLEQRAGLTLIFWDACRDNPGAEGLLRSVTYTGPSTAERVRGGAAPVPPRRGDTYIVFSAEPDKKAIDGDGQFSPFAESLARYLAVPGLEIDDMLRKVTREVRERTRDAQSPQRLSQFIRKFYFQKGASGEEQNDAEVIRNVAAIPELLSSEKRRIIFTPVAMPAPKNRINNIEPFPAAPKNIRLAQATVSSSDLPVSPAPEIISIAAEPEASTIIHRLRISPNGKLLALGDNEGLVRIIRLSDFTVVKTIRAHTQRISDLDFASDNQTLLSAGRDGALRLWQINSGQKTREINIAGSIPFAARLYQDECPEHSILMGDDKGRIITWDLHRNRITTNKESHQGPVNAVAYQPEGDGTFLSAGGDGVINVRLEDDDRELAVRAHSGPILQAGYSPSGKSVYTAGNDGYVKIWQAARLQQQPKTSLAGHFKSVLAADMSRDGRLLATGGADKALNVWDVSSGRLIGRMQGHAGDIVAVAFSPDGKFIFSAGEDKTVRIWSVNNREEVATLFFQKNGDKYAGVTSDKQTFGAQNSGLISVFVDGRKLSSSEAERLAPYLGPGISISEQP